MGASDSELIVRREIHGDYRIYIADWSEIAHGPGARGLSYNVQLAKGDPGNVIHCHDANSLQAANEWVDWFIVNY